MDALSEKRCTPCEEGGPLLTEDQKKKLIAVLEPGWRIVEGHHLERTYRFPDFAEGLEFTNTVGELAEEEGHHPDIFLTWGRVVVTIFTHKAGGLTANDFILAAKLDSLA